MASKSQQQVQQLGDNVQASQAVLAQLQGKTEDLQDINERLKGQIDSILQSDSGLRDEMSNMQHTVHQVWSLCSERCTLVVQEFPVLVAVLQKI